MLFWSHAVHSSRAPVPSPKRYIFLVTRSKAAISVRAMGREQVGSIGMEVDFVKWRRCGGTGKTPSSSVLRTGGKMFGEYVKLHGTAPVIRVEKGPRVPVVPTKVGANVRVCGTKKAE